MEVNGQCQVSVDLKVYPLRTSRGPLEEGRSYSVLCEVESVAPAQNMTVVFYRGLRELSVQSSSSDQKSPREQRGPWAQFWCQVRLELGPEGPQPPPVVSSQNITVSVHFSEDQVEAPPTHASREHDGRATISAQSQQGVRQQPEVQEPKGTGHAPGSSALVLLVLLHLHL
ncbi:hypothetical protein WMY93_005786 [Mugilogobius chulae]|uniref:Uncharacterized protein n=1 Tax=Mugilogobius chulae TaxID=88201 RepID=A0AAW0PKK3_9GOBI